MRKSSSRGASLVEYALILALVAVLVVGALIIVGRGVSGALSTVGTRIQNTGQQAPPPAPTPAPLHNVGDPCSPPSGGTWHLNGGGVWVCNKS